MSVVFYKFKSAKEFDSATFDGNGISVFELKREIILKKKLGKGVDFDLHLYNAQNEDEELLYLTNRYQDDQMVINRNSSVLVSRRPAIKPGKGNAQKYLNMTPVVLPPTRSFVKTAVIQQQPKAAPVGSDIEKMDAMFKQQNEYWQQTQDNMAAVRPIYRPPAQGGIVQTGRGGQTAWMGGETRPPPPGYICYRCGKSGHHIQMCPTIGDPEYDNKPKLKKTTGIPRMFVNIIIITFQLKTVSKDAAPSGSGVMVTQDGEFVVSQPNDSVFLNISPSRRAYKSADSNSHQGPPELSCLLCKQLLREAGIYTFFDYSKNSMLQFKLL
jgi:protein MPE1